MSNNEETQLTREATRALAMRQQYLGSLCQLLADRILVPEEELHEICRDLDIDYDDLPSRGRAGKARDLVKQVDHSERLSSLTDACARVCPYLTWPAAPRAGKSDLSGPAPGSSVSREQQGYPSSFCRRALARGQRTARQLLQRLAAMVRRARRQDGQYWHGRYGEPIWVEVPAGEFRMGGSEDGGPQHHLCLERFWISKVPITVAQYRRFVKATGYRPPNDWPDGHPRWYWENCPVTYVSWHDALGYCGWLSETTGKSISLPTEAQWEKAARGDQDGRVYPWGDEWDCIKCNTSELGRDDTMPAGTFLGGASPYGCLDMAGQVYEWTASLWGEDWQEPRFGYPYDPSDGREDLGVGDGVFRVIRGGSFVGDKARARCSHRSSYASDTPDFSLGFRVVSTPTSATHALLRRWSYRARRLLGRVRKFRAPANAPPREPAWTSDN